MTVIIGADYGSEILVLSDTRVSIDSQDKTSYKDQLIKLVSISFGGRNAVLGFSGNVAYVKYIVELLKIKAQHYKSSGDLKSDLGQWIEDAIAMRRPRHHVQFMLCDYDPIWDSRIYIYDVAEDGKVTLYPHETINTIVSGGRLGRGKLAVIGSGSEIKNEIYETLLHPFGNPSQYDSYDAYSNVRMLMIQGIVSYKFADKESRKVGGPFVVMRIRQDSNALLGPHYIWPVSKNDNGASDIQVQVDGRKTVLSRPSTGEKFDLYKISNYSDADFSQGANAIA